MAESSTPAEIASLARASAYPRDAHAEDGVRWIQTHISHVFLTRTHVYKLRKAIGLGFLDFSTLAARNDDCLREIALNRRLAPDVYLGVAPLLPAAEGVAFGPAADGLRAGCEHAVVMRRLPEGQDALSLLERGALGAGEIDAIAARVAGFHASHGLGVPAPFASEAWRERVAAPMRANVLALREAARAGVVSSADVEAFARATESSIAAHAAPLERRRTEGRAVDGHGDLHLQHAWFEPAAAGEAKLSLIDCIEFSDTLRQIDAASEVAFLAMDLRHRGASALAERFLRRYAALRDDFGLYDVVDFFCAYRAAVRAKVASLAAADAAIPAAQRARAADSATRHLALARSSLGPRATGAVALVCGSVGTGKSTLAEALADACGGVVVSSDRTRKALAGLAPESRVGAHAGAPLYAEAMTDRVYAALLERAAPVLRSGRPAILDATFAHAVHRDAARGFARASGVPAVLVEATCAEGVARERAARRAASGTDPSDAGPELVAASRARFEPVREWPPADAFAIATDRERTQAFEAACRRLRDRGTGDVP